MADLAEYVTVQEAAKALGYHVAHVRRMLREKDLEGIKVGYMWFISKASLDKYIKENEGMGKFDPRRGNRV